MDHQRGNTFIGFVLGLLISLGLSAAVAVFWSDIPAGMAAAVHEKTKKSLVSSVSSSVAAPVKKEQIESGGEKEAATSNGEVKGNSEKQLTSDAKNTLSVDSVNSKNENIELSPERLYRLQAGSFKDPEQAESIKAQLAMIGIEAKVVEREGEDGKIFRVIAGPFSETIMKDLRAKMHENGIQAIAVKAKD